MSGERARAHALTVRLTKAELTGLQRRARAEERSMAQIIRRAIRAYLGSATAGSDEP